MANWSFLLASATDEADDAALPFPRFIVRLHQCLVDKVGMNNACYANQNSGTEDTYDSEALFARELKTPNDWDGQ